LNSRETGSPAAGNECSAALAVKRGGTIAGNFNPREVNLKKELPIEIRDPLRHTQATYLQCTVRQHCPPKMENADVASRQPCSSSLDSYLR
jgi:hypothetical protein